MPELPEVQVVINYLKENVLNKKIKAVDVHLAKLIKNTTVDKFINFFINRSFIDIIRKGKYLLFILDNNTCFVAHLRMEGKFFYESDKYDLTKHDHIVFHFQNSLLIYNDTRQFGTMNIYDSYEKALESTSLKKLGYEPFSDNFKASNLFSLSSKSNKFIKTLLLDQHFIAGIGNIYADEILFASKISPLSISKKINLKQWEMIVENTKLILSESIKHNGTTIHTFKFNNFSTGNFQDFLKVHTKKGKPCPVCKTPIIKTTVNGRGTYYCSKCQKLYE